MSRYCCPSGIFETKTKVGRTVVKTLTHVPTQISMRLPPYPNHTSWNLCCLLFIDKAISGIDILLNIDLCCLLLIDSRNSHSRFRRIVVYNKSRKRELQTMKRRSIREKSTRTMGKSTIQTRWQPQAEDLVKAPPTIGTLSISHRKNEQNNHFLQCCLL